MMSIFNFCIEWLLMRKQAIVRHTLFIEVPNFNAGNTFCNGRAMANSLVCSIFKIDDLLPYKPAILHGLPILKVNKIYPRLKLFYSNFNGSCISFCLSFDQSSLCIVNTDGYHFLFARINNVDEMVSGIRK